MRVSNVHHETSVHSLFYMQEVEPETYARLTQRIGGIDMAGKMGVADYFIHELPFMFKDWAEYRDYLLDKLIEDPDWHAGFKKEFVRQEKLYGETEVAVEMRRNHINSLLTNDWEHIKLSNWERRPQIYNIKRQQQGKSSWAR